MHFNGDQKIMPRGPCMLGGVDEGLKTMCSCEYAQPEHEYALFI